MLRTAGRWAFHLTLAYVLLIQLTLSGIAATQHALVNASGVLCMGATGQGDGSAPGQQPHEPALCCALGCTAAGQTLLAPPAGLSLALPSAYSAPGILAPAARHDPARTPLSFSARGPPARG
ncbi:hypothetical protein ACLBXM_11670 [Xanthobacteraceae bacterium A53D]